MSELTLTKTETAILTAAATEHGGALVLSETMKPVTAGRFLGKLRKHSLIEAEGEPRLTRTGYKLVGIKPPRASRTERAAETAEAKTAAPRSGGKRQVVLDLLKRRDGASLTELVEATGWLPHTTRAVICRLRKDGQEIGKSDRPDGRSAYVIAPEPKPRRDRSRATALAA